MSQVDRNPSRFSIPIQDSLQAFASSIASLLSSRAVLSSVGVGDSSASPTAALLLSILQESAGRIATILFAHRFGTSLEPECKMYRLLADVLNDIAFVLDCLSPIFPKPVRVVVLSFSSVLRALCGVAAGSAKASLSAHFARWGNLGELNAKDSSQETVISLVGMLVGSLVVSWVTTPMATWTALILLLSVHLETNRRAVRAVCMESLNRQRATLVYHALKDGDVPSPAIVASKEAIFERDGVLRSSSGRVLGYCRVGVSMTEFLSAIAGRRNQRTGSVQISGTTLTKLTDLYKDDKYMLWYSSNGGRTQVSVIIKSGAVSTDIVCAWWQALAVAEQGDQRITAPALKEDNTAIFDHLKRTKAQAVALLQTHQDALVKSRWDLEVGALETTSSTRITLGDWSGEKREA